MKCKYEKETECVGEKQLGWYNTEIDAVGDRMQIRGLTRNACCIVSHGDSSWISVIDTFQQHRHVCVLILQQNVVTCESFYESFLLWGRFT